MKTWQAIALGVAVASVTIVLSYGAQYLIFGHVESGVPGGAAGVAGAVAAWTAMDRKQKDKG